MSLFRRPSSADHQRLLADLEALGLFRYTTPKDLEASREAILQEGWPGILKVRGRLFPANAEELAEGGVSTFLADVTPFLEDQGVTVPALEDALGEEYDLLAGEERIPIWTRAEFQRELAGEPGLGWGLSSARTLQILNDWLEQAESAERAYGVNSGRNFTVFFLTSELYSRIRREPEASPKHGPYVPDLHYPSFGQPR
jgi:hypothetical protein